MELLASTKMHADPSSIETSIPFASTAIQNMFWHTDYFSRMFLKKTHCVCTLQRFLSQVPFTIDNKTNQTNTPTPSLPLVSTLILRTSWGAVSVT